LIIAKIANIAKIAKIAKIANIDMHRGSLPGRWPNLPP